MNQTSWGKSNSPYRLPYQRTFTNEQVMSMVINNPAIYGDPQDKNSRAYKMIKSLGRMNKMGVKN